MAPLDPKLVGLINSPCRLDEVDIETVFWAAYPRFRFLKSLPLGARLLDIGAGSGGTALWRMWQPPLRPDIRMFGVDLERGEHAGLYEAWETADLNSELPRFDGGRFDGFLASHLIEHLVAPRRLFARIAAVASPGARLYLEWPNPASMYLPPASQLAAELKFTIQTFNFYDDRTHRKTPDRASVERMLAKQGFSVVESAEVRLGLIAEEMIAWGQAHDDLTSRQMGLWSAVGWSNVIVAEFRGAGIGPVRRPPFWRRVSQRVLRATRTRNNQRRPPENGAHFVTSPETKRCPVCLGFPSLPFRHVDGIECFKCGNCGSIFADPAFLDKTARGAAQTDREEYWQAEHNAALARCYDSSPIRVAETLLYCRRPVRRFLDIGAGSGHLLDALAELLPAANGVFHAVEACPPAAPHRTTHPNFVEGSVRDVPGPFDAGVCVEVIDHLVPDTLRTIVRELADVSAPGSLYYFSSGQPERVEQEGPGYLDPTGRGRLLLYSIAGLRAVFEPLGFNIIPLPGRDWAFLAEFGPVAPVSRDDLYKRVWHPVPENIALLTNDRFGSLLHTAGLEAARCYLELDAPPPPVSVARSVRAMVSFRTRRLIERLRPTP